MQTKVKNVIQASSVLGALGIGTSMTMTVANADEIPVNHTQNTDKTVQEQMQSSNQNKQVTNKVVTQTETDTTQQNIKSDTQQTVFSNTSNQNNVNAPKTITPKPQVKMAVTNNATKTQTVPARSYGVDVSSFQGTNLTNDAKNGSRFAIVKVSEGTTYRNYSAAGQVASAKQNGQMVMAYHFANFGNNSNAARTQANYAISAAKQFGVPDGSYIACDWESGDGNNINGGKDSSANAIIAFMDTVKQADYKPMLYSGSSLLRNNIATDKILAKYPNSLWVASYATVGRIDIPDFNYFPSMNGVAIWQFTDNWKGMNVDGNISLVPLSVATPVTTPVTPNKPTTTPVNTSTNSSNNSVSNNTNNASKPATAPVNSPVNTNKPMTKPVNTNDGWVSEKAIFVPNQTINLRTGASTSNSIITTVKAGSEIQYDAYKRIGDYVWLRQPRNNGSYGYLVARYDNQALGSFKEITTVQSTKPTQNNNTTKPTTTPANSNDGWVSEKAIFVPSQTINLRTGASTANSVITTVKAGSEIQYDAYKRIGDYVWLRQPRANGTYGYLVARYNNQALGSFKEITTVQSAKPVTTKPAATQTNNSNNGWTRENGSFTSYNAINLRSGAGTNYSVITTLPANTKIRYDAYKRIGNYVWLRQPRANGSYSYLVGRVGTNAWGVFGN